MMSLTDLPLSFWGYALETATFTLNRAPSKSVETHHTNCGMAKDQSCRFLKFGDVMLMSKSFSLKSWNPKRKSASS